MGITHAYAGDITKAERDANGDLIVYGKATGPDLDLDEQVCDPGWLKSAMPEWMTFGNLREMHQPIAAGVGMELSAEGEDWFVKSQVVDEGTAKKIEAGALKGYSVGIKNAKVVKDATAPGGRIVGGSIVEVSYVDRPCNPTATLAIAKAATLDKSAPLLPVDAAGDLLEGIEDWPIEDETGTDDDETAGEQVKGTLMSERDLVALIQKTVLDQQDTRKQTDRDKAIALVKAVGPDGQIDETLDIAGGKEAIALIAKLIGYEADELAAGELDEACDISLLVSAVECLKMWLEREQGTDTDAGVTYVELDAEADTTKTTEADAKTVSKDEVNDLVKAAVTEATKAAQESVDALAAELAKVKARPIPGGPVITAANHRRQDAPTDDLNKAAYYEHMATQVQEPSTAAGYRQKAAELRQRHAEQSH